MALIDRIKFDGAKDGKPWLVYKCPSDQYVVGSQLIVSEGQEAVFFKGGEALDLFGAGTHTLHSRNLPLLDKLVNIPFGGETPFAAEIYFVNTIANLEMKWGTSSPIPLEDPKYGILLNIGAHGQYGMSINDSRLFVTRLVGSLPGGTLVSNNEVLRYFNGLINTRVKSAISSNLVERGVSFLEISQFLPELSDQLSQGIAEEFSRFGIKILNFFCESIGPNPEEYAKLRQFKEELALGNDFYRQRRSFDVMEKLAENPSSGSLADAGIGLGMGIGAAQHFGAMFAGLSQGVNVGDSNEVGAYTNEINTERHNARASVKACPQCSQQIEESARFCSNCGASFSLITCKECGVDVPQNARFCSSCGAEL